MCLCHHIMLAYEILACILNLSQRTTYYCVIEKFEDWASSTEESFRNSDTLRIISIS